jgi:DNA (cytosine-5)-methyltransferase 1
MNSAYFQVQAADSLERCSLDSGPSAMLNGMTTASESLPQESKTESCPTPLSSAISKHSSLTGTPQAIRAWLMSFPCQPFSVAGKQKGADDERNMWPATATVIGIVKPRFVLLENVPGVRTYLPVVVRDLRRLGYEVSRPLILGADDVGAPHRRKRVWIMAHSPQRQDDGREQRDMDGTTGGREGIDAPTDFGGQDVADADETGRGEQRKAVTVQSEHDPPECSGSWWSSDPADTICICGDDAGHGTGEVCGECESSEICGLSRWGLKSRVGRVVNGCPDRIHRLKALGNMQVSSVVATAWRILTRDL